MVRFEVISESGTWDVAGELLKTEHLKTFKNLRIEKGSFHIDGRIYMNPDCLPKRNLQSESLS